MEQITVGTVRWTSNRGEGLVAVLWGVPGQAETGNRGGWRRVHVVPNDERGAEQTERDTVDGEREETIEDGARPPSPHASGDAHTGASDRSQPRAISEPESVGVKRVLPVVGYTLESSMKDFAAVGLRALMLGSVSK